jgi:hypothetical protein
MFGVDRVSSIFAAGRNSTCDKMMAKRKVTVNMIFFLLKVKRKGRLLRNQRTHMPSTLDDKQLSLTLG